MKKIISTTVILMTLILSLSAASDSHIKYTDLPQKAKQFIHNYFHTNQIAYITKDRDFLSTSYELLFTDGTKVEFDGDGQWKEVKCKDMPWKIIPSPIRRVISQKFDGQKIIKIEKEKKGYEIKLTSGLEIKFNSQFRIIEVDD